MPNIINSTTFRKNAYKIIDEINENHNPVYITGKRSNAVLLSSDDYNAMQESLYLLSMPGMRESIIDGINEPIIECSENISL